MHVGTEPVYWGQAINLVFTALLGCICTIMTITRTAKKSNRPPWGAIGLLALFIGANFP